MYVELLLAVLVHKLGRNTMSTKIGIIATPFLEKFIKEQIAKMDLEFEYELFLYNEFRDIPKLFANMSTDITGVMTSGVFPAAVILKSFPETDKVIEAFNSDDAGICRLFLNLYKNNKNWDIDRVHGDFLDLIGSDLADYLFNDPMRSLNSRIDDVVQKLSLEELYVVEQKQFDKHVSLFKSGKVDCAVTRFSSIVDKLCDIGMEVYFPYPSFSYMYSQFENLLKNISMCKLKNSQPAVINVSVNIGLMESSAGFVLQSKFMLLEEALRKFCGNSTLEYLVQKNHFGYEVLTDRKHLLKYTKDFSNCTLSCFLREILDFPILVGYGIGVNLYQARLNAANAIREAGVSKLGSFVIDEEEQLIGPIGNECSNIATVLDFDSAVFGSSFPLSPTTVSRVLMATRSLPSSRITARELAFKLGVTTRSANRFLRTMSERGVLEVVAEKSPTTRGRPERVFKICV